MEGLYLEPALNQSECALRHTSAVPGIRGVILDISLAGSKTVSKMGKKCAWGLCDSDSRYPERLQGGVKFILFPRPLKNLERCLRWIKSCGRPHEQLNVRRLEGNYNVYVCSKVRASRFQI